jgi:3-hydroxybutyryl-CoA dehydrogenase
VRTADVAVDFVPDELESKLEIFCLVDRMAPPRTILLTPSDAMSITDLASCTYRGDRCFAVRGGLENAASDDRAAAVAASQELRRGRSAERRWRDFLRALGGDPRAEESIRVPPMLVKNLL